MLRNILVISLATILLIGCGGGGSTPMGGDSPFSDISWPVNPDVARRLTGGSAPPDLTSNQIVARLEALNRSANSLQASDILVFSRGNPERIFVACGVTTCQVTYRGRSSTLSLSDVVSSTAEDFEGEDQVVMTHRGVSLAQGRGRGRIAGEKVTAVTYGGWLEHSYFATEAGGFEESGFAYVGSYSVGDATGTNPTGSVSENAMWEGVMVGADVSASPTRGHVIQGSVGVTVHFGAGSNITTDIAFTNIRDLDAGSGRSDMSWRAIPLTDGGFLIGSVGNQIEGRFYGPNHEEVGGIFERNHIIGAFGAKRTP